jgi:dipeptidase E
MRLLLFSNSTDVGEDYLNFTLTYIDKFLTISDRKALFIPYAAVSIGFEEYFMMVLQKLKLIGIKLSSLHHSTDQIRSIEKSKIIIVGGGNTFCLLKKLQELNLLEIIKKKVLIVKAPYISWSAGSNLACPTIKTTNDMPIVQPMNFNSLNLVPFQINPHYTDLKIEGHGGETREMRINEFLTVNPTTWVVGLREGTLLQLSDKNILLKGTQNCRIFKYNHDPIEISPVDDLNFIMQ